MRANIENAAEVQIAGMLALNKTLGPIGTIRFLQQFNELGSDYTQEKYDKLPLDLGEVMARLEAVESARGKG